jgi:hypothetical protein
MESYEGMTGTAMTLGVFIASYGALVAILYTML